MALQYWCLWCSVSKCSGNLFASYWLLTEYIPQRGRFAKYNYFKIEPGLSVRGSQLLR